MIDFVVLWVDGNDRAWQKEKAQYSPKKTDDSNSANRFRDWGLMPYWFRAIEKFTPWVRKIHFVTWGHLPEFLDTTNPKLNIVKHTDFMPEGALPTFSSHALEVNLHRIPDLAENFVYFNDDMFILRPMTEEAFFKDGLPCTYGREVPMPFIGEIGIWQHASANNMGIINKHFDKRTQFNLYKNKFISKAYRWQDNLRAYASWKLFPNYFYGFENLHAPGAYCKKTFIEVWEKEPEALEATTYNKFRQASDLNQWIMLWWQVASGNFNPYCTDNFVCSTNEKTVGLVCDFIENQEHDMICINDPDNDVNFEMVSEKVRSSFQKILPEKSSFEK
jgi:hypothetical protein